MIYALAAGSAVSAGYCAYLVTAAVLEAVSSAAYRLRLEARLGLGADHRVSRVALRIAVNRVMKMRAGADVAKRVADAGLRRPEETVFLLFAGAPAVVILSALLLGPTAKAAIPIIALALGINAWLKKQAGDRLKRFSEQLPSVFKSVAAALKAGASFQQALVHAADQANPPAADELAAVNEQIALGLPVDEALGGLHARLPAIELNFVLMGLSIQRRIGGNLVKLLTETTEAIEERRRLRRHLDVETAQARLSAKVIGFLPIAVTGLIAIVDPSYIAPLFTTPTGLVMVFVAASAETAGFLLLGQILEIKI